MPDYQHDMSCVPFPQRGLYFALTVPFLLVLVVVLGYMATVNLLLALPFVACYLLACWFQAYCCAYQKCPYVGGFCPAIAGIWLANPMARIVQRSGLVPRSQRGFETYALLAIASWCGLALFPVAWIARLSGWLAGGYVLLHIVYAVVFFLTVCPSCAIRHTCPGGGLQKILRRSR
jgi:hypothetical protein